MNLDTERERLFTVSDFGSTKTELNTDQAKKLWINIYNAYYQIEARKSTINRKTILALERSITKLFKPRRYRVWI
jgi:hypothetical protein